MRQGEFADFDFAAIGLHEVGEQIAEHEGGGFDVVGGQEQQARFFGERLAAEFEQFGKLAFHFPDVAVGAAAERGRIEQDAVVAGAALHFAADVFDGVFDDPADGLVGEAGGGLVVAGPGGRGLGGVDVGGEPAGFGADERGRAGVAEEIQQARAGGGGLLDRAPMRRLLGKHAEMLAGVGKAGEEGQRAEAERPFAGAAGTQVPAGVFVVDGAGLVPFARGQRRLPPRLGLAADDDDGAEAFELAAAAGVDELVVGEAAERGSDGGGFRHRLVRRRCRRRGGRCRAWRGRGSRRIRRRRGCPFRRGAVRRPGRR